MKKIPVIIDTDPGVDDSVAIMMLAASEKTDIKAVTTTHGNVGLAGTTKNALGLRELLGLDCEVAMGADRPMIVPQKEASFFHGSNGVAAYEMPTPTKPVSREKAWDLMYRYAKEYEGELVLVSLGPMTNTALAILKYPDFAKKVKRIYMMGGSRSWGNHSQYAEFNIWGDPHACSVVLESGIPVTMADLVFGNSLKMNGKKEREILSHAKKLKPFAEAIMNLHKTIADTLNSQKGELVPFDETESVFYDTSAAIALLEDGESLVTDDYYVLCETQSSTTNGMTVFDYKGYMKKERNVQLCVDVDKDKYFELLTKAFSHFE